MWAKVRQLTGRGRTHRVKASNRAITTNSLNEHYALISTDAAYTPPLVKSTSFEGDSQISEFQIFRILDHLRHTASGLDGIPAWFLRLAAPVLAAPIADLFNMSLDVPWQWHMAAIHPIPKIPSPSLLDHLTSDQFLSHPFYAESLSGCCSSVYLSLSPLSTVLTNNV